MEEFAKDEFRMDNPNNNQKLDPKEYQAVSELRTLLADVLKDDVSDSILLKFLRSKNFNIKKTERTYRAYSNLLVASQIEKMITTWEKPEILEKFEFTGELGFAKNGSPVRYTCLGRADLIGLMYCINTINAGRFCIYYTEKDLKKGREHGKKIGKDINEITYIIDMEGFSLRHVFFPGSVELGLDLFRIGQEYYPEIWKKVLIINIPAYFHVVFNIFKPIFRRNLLEDIEIASSSNSAQLLLKYIDADVLPAFLGGNRVDSKGDKMCKEFIKFGGEVPDKYYLKNNTALLSPTEAGVIDKWLSPRCCYNHSVVVTEANSLIRVQFRTEGGPIQVAALYKKFGPNPDIIDVPGMNEYLDDHNKNYEIIAPTAHCRTHHTPVDNDLFAARPGIYVFKFDNTHSWFSSRRLILKVWIESPLTF